MLVRGISYALNSNYQTSRTNLEVSMRRLSSGDKFAKTGVELGGELSVSERFRHRIRSAEASINSVQAGMSFLQNASENIDTVYQILNRMQEIAAATTDPMITADDRDVFNEEFQLLKAEIPEISRQAQFFGKQTVGRDTIVSYDANTKKLRFWQPTGDDPQEISRKFDSDATDVEQSTIGFDPSEDFSMSRDGKSLFFLGNEPGDGAGVLRLKRYDIDTQMVTTSSDLYATGDKLFVQEDGQLYVNGSGTLYDIDEGGLSRTATAITDMTADTEFTIYNDAVKYYRSSDNRIVSYDLNTATTTQLTAPITFASGGVDHSFSGSGRFIADESVAGTIRVIDTSTGNTATYNVGAGTALNNLKFNEDGDRIYFIDQDGASVHYINVGVDRDDNISLTAGAKVIQGTNSSSFNGLDLGGSNYGSSVSFVLSQDSVSVLSYEAADLSLYALGLSDTRVDTIANAETALSDLKEALNRTNAERAKISAMASRFEHVMNSHRNYIADLTNAESQIRDVDLAKETGYFSAMQVQNQSATAMLAQFNNLSKNVMVLLNS
ncbi:MAG: hypothetical protein CMO81_05045 [Waddliaceae bacterium]|nr:hypothetical protein [Waddliaceae bacterium]